MNIDIAPNTMHGDAASASGDETTVRAARNAAATARFLPWVVASALFMEQLDTTIVNTCIPAMAASFHAAPLSLKAVSASYVLSLAVAIPASGWLAERFGSRRIFLLALALFTIFSMLCGFAIDVNTLVAARIPQGVAAAMMLPVGRMAIVRTFPKAQLLRAMNFVIIPALLGPLLGPTLGGVITHWLSWRDIFFVNVPIGLAAIWAARKHMPDYRAETVSRFDLRGFILFGAGAAVLSWVFEAFGESGLRATGAMGALALALLLFTAYAWHARRMSFPLLAPSLFGLRTYRVAVLGSFVTRLGVGGMPLLLPLLYQLGLGMPAWQSGLMMMPSALAAIGMRLIVAATLRRFGYRRVLLVNTVVLGGVIASFALIDHGVPLGAIVLLALAMGLFNSLQFSSMNSLAYADVSPAQAAMASTMASAAQQMSMSFGLGFASLVAGFFMAGLAQTSTAAVVQALHHTFLVLAVLTIVSSLSFWGLRGDDGESVSLAGAMRHRPTSDTANPA